MIKKITSKTIILIITTVILMGLVIFIVGRSYGFFQYTKQGETTNIISIKGLKARIIEDNNALNLIEAEPLYDEDGMEQSAFVFSITNTSSRAKPYIIKLQQDTVKQSECLINEGTPEEAICPVLPISNIRFSIKINDGEYSEPKNLNEVSGIIDDTGIDANETKTYSLKIWIKEDATNEIMGDYFFGSLILQSQQALAAGLYDENDSLIMGYDEFASTYGYDVEEDASVIYVYDSIIDNEWKHINLETFASDSIDYADIPNNALAKLFGENGALSNTKKIVLPNGITRIGKAAIASCTSVEELVLPNGLTRIEDNSIIYNSNLKRINIPNTVTYIGETAFTYDDLRSITIPGSVEKIGQGAFATNGNLRKVIIEDGVTEIGSLAFYETGGLKIDVPSSVTTIAENAFAGVIYINYHGTAVPNASYPYFAAEYMNPYIEGDFAYMDNTKERLISYIGTDSNVVVPNGVTIIDNYAFTMNEDVVSVSLPSSVTSIGSYVFAHCKNLETINIPSGVTAISQGVFENCKALKTVTLPSGITDIRMLAFSSSGIETLTIPASVTNIDHFAFLECNSLTSVTFEDPNGWFRKSLPSSGSDAVVLSNPTQNAEYLRDSYVGYIFVKQ